MSAEWLLLRGLGRSARHWGSFTEHLSSVVGGPCHVLDLAGNGTELSRPSFLTIEDNVEDLRIRSTALRKGRRVSLLAISMGAMVALKWAELYPGEIERVVVMNVSDRRSGRFFERLRPGNYFSFLSLLLRPGDLLGRERTILRMTTHLLPDFESQAKLQTAYPATSLSNFIRQLWAASGFSSSETAPACPVLFLGSEDDRLVSSVCSRRLADLWRVPLQLHPTAGHDLPLDAPEWVCHQIQESF